MDMQSSAAMSSMGTMTTAASTGAMSSMMPTATATTAIGSSMDMDMGGSGACKISVRRPIQLSTTPTLMNLVADQNLFPMLDVVELGHHRRL